MTDILMELNWKPPFTWGLESAKDSLDAEGAKRVEYISALKVADRDQYTSLIKFLRS